MDWSISVDLNEAVTVACREETLVDALTYIAVWDSERAVRQAIENYKTKVILSSEGTFGFVWDTCFKVCFEAVILKWQKEERDETPKLLTHLKLLLNSIEKLIDEIPATSIPVAATQEVGGKREFTSFTDLMLHEGACSPLD